MKTQLKAQPGPQEDFLKSSADVAFYGGGAGSGKSFGLLLEQLFDVDNSGSRSVIFRRTVPMLRQPGGLVDTSGQIFPLLGAKFNQSLLEWQFPSGATAKFSGMELESDRFSWQGAQISLVCFDEAQEFEESQFWFLFSRLRSMSGAKCRVRCTCNPIPEGWLRSLLGWWINPDTGLPITERSGVLRWFIRDGDALVWGESPAELVEKFGPDVEPKSLTFIPALVQHNRILLEQDRNYVSNLKALPLVERQRLLDGNWNVRATAGSYFRREWFGAPLDAPPSDIIARVRFWDRAATEKKPGNDPDATVGCLLSKTNQGIYTVEHIIKLYATPHAVDKEMLRCAESDGRKTTVAYSQDPASAGVNEAQSTARFLDGFDVKFRTVTGDKETRARPVSSQAEAGNIRMVRGPWNHEFLRELENFPTGKHDDCVDALVGAYEKLNEQRFYIKMVKLRGL